MAVGRMDPSLSLGFYLRDAADLADWRHRVACLADRLGPGSMPFAVVDSTIAAETGCPGGHASGSAAARGGEGEQDGGAQRGGGGAADFDELEESESEDEAGEAPRVFYGPVEPARHVLGQGIGAGAMASNSPLPDEEDEYVLL